MAVLCVLRIRATGDQGMARVSQFLGRIMYVIFAGMKR